ncbi:unnamed protein product, partial [Medioppia subpectinata]
DGGYDETDSDRFMIGSFPKGFGYPEDDNDIQSNDVTDRALTGEVKPRILIMGLRRYVTLCDGGYDETDSDRFMIGSFPKGFGYPEDDNDIQSNDVTDRALTGEVKPRILIMGLRRSGKSSIQKVVFHKMSPNETLFLESTNKIVKDDISNSSFVSFTIWDFPGQIDFFDSTFDSENIFGGCGALVFVIDAQDDYMEALSKLHHTVKKAHQVNADIKFEVFIHKVDGLSDDHKIETQRDIHQRANEDLMDSGDENILLSFYLTSIYDHSIFEAFSKVVQKLIPQLPTLENLLNIFITVFDLI